LRKTIQNNRKKDRAKLRKCNQKKAMIRNSHLKREGLLRGQVDKEADLPEIIK